MATHLIALTATFWFFSHVLDAHATGGLRTVALTGQQAPGAAAGVTFSNFSGIAPSLNDNGHIVFASQLAGGNLNDAGIWTGGPSAPLRLVARNGAPAPDSTLPFLGLASPQGLILNDANEVAFATDAGPRGSGNVWAESGQTLALVMRPNQQAAGTEIGATFQGLLIGSSLGAIAFNDAGRAGFAARLGSTAPTSANTGIWTGENAANLALVAREGSPAPGVAGIYTEFQPPDGPVLNDLGDAAFRANATSGIGVWMQRAGTLELVAAVGTPATGLPVSTHLTNFLLSPTINNSGHVAFTAVIANPTPPGGNNTGIWANRGNGLELVAFGGQPAPGTSPGVRFQNMFPAHVMNAEGEIAFVSSTSPNFTGIWSEGGGNGLQLVAQQGQQAPGAAPGIRFVGFNQNAGLSLNRLGQTAFFAQLTGPGITPTNDVGIWAQDVDGNLQLIARKGDLLDVSDDPQSPDLRTIALLSFAGGSGNEDGRRSGLNELGQVAFWAAFTDGTQGLFVSNLVAVPEPAAVLLIATAMLSFGLSRTPRW